MNEEFKRHEGTNIKFSLLKNAIKHFQQAEPEINYDKLISYRKNTLHANDIIHAHNRLYIIYRAW